MTINKHIVFEDLHKFWKYAMQESTAYQKSSRQTADRWSGGLSWNEAKSLALKGWKEGLREVEKYQAKISPFIAEKVLRHQQVFAISGYNVDVGSYLANDPECFISRVNEERNYPGKIFTIVLTGATTLTMDASWGVKKLALKCTTATGATIIGSASISSYTNSAITLEENESITIDNGVVPIDGVVITIPLGCSINVVMSFN